MFQEPVAASVSEALKLAEAVFVLVAVSVENQRMFSTMQFSAMCSVICFDSRLSIIYIIVS